jgi:hypothetical protein
VSGTFFRYSVLVVLLSACAAPRTESDAERLRVDVAAAERAQSAVAPGRTKDEVRAALGNGQPIVFDSGYEVWLYRWGRTELVVLFEPRGVVAKSRVRTP